MCVCVCVCVCVVAWLMVHARKVKAAPRACLDPKDQVEDFASDQVTTS